MARLVWRTETVFHQRMPEGADRFNQARTIGQNLIAEGVSRCLDASVKTVAASGVDFDTAAAKDWSDPRPTGRDRRRSAIHPPSPRFSELTLVGDTDAFVDPAHVRGEPVCAGRLRLLEESH
jgi:hypothetical protein